jgi:hypothetical protein
MTNKKDDKKPRITIHSTPEMANWMHSQTDERKELIRKRIEAAKERFKNRHNPEQ